MRICEQCGASLEGYRPQARYHAAACRAAASRARRAGKNGEHAFKDVGRVMPAAPQRNRTETAQGVPEGASLYVGGVCHDQLCCKYRHRFPTGPWTCAYNHPRHGPAS